MKSLLRVILIVFLSSIAVSCSGTAYVYVENMHSAVTYQGGTPYPELEVTVNGDTKNLLNGHVYSNNYYEWEITWFGFQINEDVTVRATISNPPLANGGLFEKSFQVYDEDEKEVIVTYCSGWSEN